LAHEIRPYADQAAVLGKGAGAGKLSRRLDELALDLVGVERVLLGRFHRRRARGRRLGGGGVLLLGRRDAAGGGEPDGHSETRHEGEESLAHTEPSLPHRLLTTACSGGSRKLHFWKIVNKSS